MNKLFTFLLFAILTVKISSQTFIRTELTTTLTTPWEMTLGPDGYLWLTEANGIVSRVDPNSAVKQIIYQAQDYCPGFPAEQCQSCHQPNIGVGTLGLALHPDFTDPQKSYIYYVYSYNSGTNTNPATKFKIVRLLWSAASQTITAATDLVTMLPTGYDHLGGRLIATKQNGNDYLYFSVGDNGVSESNSPTCYNPQSLNPNNFCQDTAYKNGKVLRYKIDGSIPFDNPIAGSPVYTRGHRNPQGLIYNQPLGIVYEIEHGDRTDDEINIVEPGKNYGWKHIRGYHSDNNYPGEATSISSFTPNPGITGDGLKEPLFSWCSTPQPTIGTNYDWCTVAPSDGIHYSFNGTGIPGWENSLLVVTLKKGANTDREMYKLMLTANGLSLTPSTSVTPNPERLFAQDQTLNGRLRDIALSSDGKKIYLINNGGADRDKITVYTYSGPTGTAENVNGNFDFNVYPNPTDGRLTITSNQKINCVEVFDVLGKKVYSCFSDFESVTLPEELAGYYLIKVKSISGKEVMKPLVKTSR